VDEVARPQTGPFRRQVLVRFGDCDPAGIVFYPRYFEMFNNLVEDWHREALQFSFTEIVTTRSWGLPTVHLEADFVAPTRFGEVLSASLSVREIGTTSVSLDILLQGPDGADRVRGKVVLVWIDRRVTQSIPIPDEVRARLLAFRVPDDSATVMATQGENKP
jgi:4-hydroxybenzoyl-CoA thioesterase